MGSLVMGPAVAWLSASTDSGCEGPPAPQAGVGNSTDTITHKGTLTESGFLFSLEEQKDLSNPSATSEMIMQEKNFRWESVVKNKYSCPKLLKI